MRILFVTEGLGWFRGTQRMFFECIRYFKSSGHEVLVLGYGEIGDTAERIRRFGVEVLNGKMSISKALEFHPDIVNIHRGGGHRADETKLLACFKDIGAKIIETSVFGRVDRSCERLIDLSIQISRWDLYRWNRWKGHLGVLGIYLPYIVDTDSFVPSDADSIVQCRCRWGIPQDAFVIGRAGKTSWEKLTESVLSVLDRYPSVYFVSVKDYNHPIPEKLLSHPRVRQIPKLVSNEELSEFYSACSVFVSASPFGESFGMVVAEAMACGVPVVATANPECDNAQAEVVTHGVGGLLVAQGRDIADALALMIERPIERAEFASHAREVIESRYSRENVCGKLDEVFRLVLSNATPDMYENKGFEIDVPQDAINDIIRNVIGEYAFIPRVYQLQNLSWFWRRVYEIYDVVRNGLKCSVE